MTSETPPERPSLVARLALALRAFIKIVFEPRFAGQVALLEAPASAPPPQEPPESPAANASPDAEATAEADPAVIGALTLLRVLQREGRFIDFVQQDIAAFSDADVGAAARVVHDGCRAVLHQQLELRAISDVAEDEPSKISDPEEIRSGRWKLTGNVGGAPPHQGFVRHCGWLALQCRLPQSVGNDDPAILCPAELET